MGSKRSLCFKKRVVIVLFSILAIGDFLAANELPSLDGLSLFMSHSERDKMDNDSPFEALLPESVAEVQPAVPAAIQSVEKTVSLNGAVIRPDHSAVLLLNTGTEILQKIKPSTESDLRFDVKAYRQVLTLSPGETVRVRINGGQ